MKKKIVIFIVTIYFQPALFAAENIIEDKVIIRGGTHERIEAEKMPIRQEFNIDQVLTFDMKPVQDIYTFENTELNADQYIKVPGYKPLAPLSGVKVKDIIVSDTIKIFQPKELKKAQSWRLTILDSMGKEVCDFNHVKSGSNKSIIWDGRDTEGRMLKVGYPYSAIFEWSKAAVQSDALGNIIAWKNEDIEKHTEIVKSFVVDAVAYIDEDVTRIDVAYPVLYDQKEKIIRDDIIDQIAVIVKSRFKKPVLICMYADNEHDAAEQANTIKRRIAQKLVAPIDMFESKGFPITDRRTRLEIIVGGTKQQE